MSTINDYELTIEAPVAKVWQALTDKRVAEEWMLSVKVESDWAEGANIRFTCYDDKGNVAQWQGMDMIWNGTITRLVEQKEFTTKYDGSAGVLLESYLLDADGPTTTRVKFHQECTNEEAAKGYREGTDEQFVMLKKYLER